MADVIRFVEEPLPRDLERSRSRSTSSTSGRPASTTAAAWPPFCATRGGAACGARRPHLGRLLRDPLPVGERGRAAQRPRQRAAARRRARGARTRLRSGRALDAQLPGAGLLPAPRLRRAGPRRRLPARPRPDLPAESPGRLAHGSGPVQRRGPGSSSEAPYCRGPCSSSARTAMASSSKWVSIAPTAARRSSSRRARSRPCEPCACCRPRASSSASSAATRARCTRSRSSSRRRASPVASTRIRRTSRSGSAARRGSGVATTFGLYVLPADVDAAKRVHTSTCTRACPRRPATGRGGHRAARRARPAASRSRRPPRLRRVRTRVPGSWERT